MDESENKRTPIVKFGKYGLIDHITKDVSAQNKSTLKGIGDDAAVIDSGRNLTLVSTDLLLEGIHFNLVYTPLKHLGYKAVIRAISDIYAMNGIPGQILIALGISSRFDVEQVEEIYEGINLACERYNVDLAGGDTTSSLTGLTIGVTAIGTVEKTGIVKRDGAKPNDIICVTGDLGASYMGLQVLERERRLFDKNSSVQPDLTGYEYVIERQLKPDFPEEIIKKLNVAGIVPTAMIDISEGLASDILHICKLSKTGCRIYCNKIPVDAETSRVSEEFNLDPIMPALNGGEDYELLFTLPLTDLEKIEKIPGVRVIGYTTSPDQGFYLINEAGSEIELKAQGWEKA